MKIFFVRHGHHADGGLSKLGLRQIQKTGDFFKQLNLDIPYVRLLTSEIERAVQSAQIMQAILGCCEAEKVEWLTCDTKCDIPAYIAHFSQANPECRVIIAVSHLPEICKALENFAKSFGVRFNADPENGSVHLVDTGVKTVQRLFQPK